VVRIQATSCQYCSALCVLTIITKGQADAVMPVVMPVNQASAGTTYRRPG